MTANNINSLNPAIPGYSIRWHALGGVVLIAAIAFGTAIIVSHFRGWALDTSGRELEKTTLLLARHFGQNSGSLGSFKTNSSCTCVRRASRRMRLISVRCPVRARMKCSRS
jgi:hypothetical protein